MERAGGTSYDQLNGVALDGANGVVGAGSFESATAYFGDTELTNAGQTDAVVWKVSRHTMLARICLPTTSFHIRATCAL